MLVIVFEKFEVRVIEAECYGDQAWGKWLRDGRTVEGPIPVKAYQIWKEACAAGTMRTMDLR